MVFVLAGIKHLAQADAEILQAKRKQGSTAIQTAAASPQNSRGSRPLQRMVVNRGICYCLAVEDHCDRKQIRSGSVSSADEGHQLPRKDREAPRCGDGESRQYS